MSISKKIILALLIAAIAVFLGYMIIFSRNQIQPGDNKGVETATTTESNNATSTIIDFMATSTEDWLTYRNEEYGYTLKYPKGWQIKEDTWIQSGEKQNYVMILNNTGKVYLIINEISNGKIVVDKNMNLKMLDSIIIGGYKTEIAYIENNLNQDYYRFFIRTKNYDFRIYFVPGDDEINKSIFYSIINTIIFK